MKKITILLMIISLLIITGCDLNNKENTEVIKLNSKTYVSQLKKIKIKGTKDYFIITEKRSFESVKDNEPEGSTVSWMISIPYRINVNNVDYEGYCTIGDVKRCTDDNKKYNIVISNLKEENNNYYAEVLITKK